MEVSKLTGVHVLIPDKIDFKPTLVRKDGERTFHSIKEKNHQQDAAILNILYTPNAGYISISFTKEIPVDLQLQTGLDTMLVMMSMPHSHK